jgi:hypothetical protein
MFVSRKTIEIQMLDRADYSQKHANRTLIRAIWIVVGRFPLHGHQHIRAEVRSVAVGNSPLRFGKRRLFHTKKWIKIHSFARIGDSYLYRLKLSG